MKKLVAGLLAACALPAASNAALLDVPVPSNAYITVGSLDWAWASPCSPTGCIGGQDVLDLSYQSTQGWRLPTAFEIANRPDPTAFIFSGANVPLNGASGAGTIFTSAPGDGACAAAYFTPGFFNQCNYNDALIGAVYGDPNWTTEPNVETWLVRDVGAPAVPEPASWALMIMGFGLVGHALRGRRALAVRFA